VGPAPAVAEIRRAVRGSLAGLPPGALVLAACSGGADSLALAAATAFEAPRLGLLAGGVTVDHRLQAGSGEVAQRVAATLSGLGLGPVRIVAVSVRQRDAAAGRADGSAEPGSGYAGPEAAARIARYRALDRVAGETGAAAILLGHTLDDQAETVLLGLARGSGARSLAGMAPRSGRYLRPLLGVRRAQTAAACAALGLRPWQDPQNSDASYTRVRVRTELLPALERALGPGIPEALARTAALLRADSDFLDCYAKNEYERMLRADCGCSPGSAAGLPEGTAAAVSLPADAVAGLPDAIRSRVLRAAALAAGCPAGALTARHLGAVEKLVTAWRGQRGTDLPGGVRAHRAYGRLVFSTVGPEAEREAGRGRR
jgi:tRNA(Ile)-lysidine synthase